jgi:hypothetical protein
MRRGSPTSERRLRQFAAGRRRDDLRIWQFGVILILKCYKQITDRRDAGLAEAEA